MPILSGSALCAKQVSIIVTPAKRILQQIICFSMSNSCLAMEKKPYFFYCTCCTKKGRD